MWNMYRHTKQSRSRELCGRQDSRAPSGHTSNIKIRSQRIEAGRSLVSRAGRLHGKQNQPVVAETNLRTRCQSKSGQTFE